MSPLDKCPNYQFTPARNCTPEQDTAVQKILLSTCQSHRDQPNTLQIVGEIRNRSRLQKRYTSNPIQVYFFFHINGDHNPADIVSKHWSHAKILNMLQPLMFWKGNTAQAAIAIAHSCLGCLNLSRVASAVVRDTVASTDDFETGSSSHDAVEVIQLSVCYYITFLNVFDSYQSVRNNF